MHKIFFKKFFWLLVSCLIAIPVFAYADTWTTINAMALPALDGYVVDFSNTLTSGQVQELRSVAEGYQKETSNELATVLISDRGGNELFDISMKIFRENKIWDKQKNNGILLVIATQEKKIRITVWYGLEWWLPDSAAREVIENYIRPLVNSGDIYGAVKSFYDTVPKYIAGEYTANAAASGQTTNTNAGWWFLAFLYYIIVGIYYKAGKGTIPEKSKKYGKHAAAWAVAWVAWMISAVFGYDPSWIVLLFFGMVMGRWFVAWTTWAWWWGWSSGWWSSRGWWWGGGFSGFGWGSSWWWGAGD